MYWNVNKSKKISVQLNMFISQIKERYKLHCVDFIFWFACVLLFLLLFIVSLSIQHGKLTLTLVTSVRKACHCKKERPTASDIYQKQRIITVRDTCTHTSAQLYDVEQRMNVVIYIMYTQERKDDTLQRCLSCNVDQLFETIPHSLLDKSRNETFTLREELVSGEYCE